MAKTFAQMRGEAPFKGKSHSPETRAKMSEARTGYRKIEAKPESVKQRGRRIARSKFPLPDTCELCPAPATDRHHRDGDTDNNGEGNIQFLCHPCHIRIDNPMKKDRGQ